MQRHPFPVRVPGSGSASREIATGPGLGAVGPMQNFALLTPATKIVLCILMALGRLEFYTILVLFMPSLWRKY